MIWLNNAASSFPKPESVYTARDFYFRQGIVSGKRGGGSLDRTAIQLSSQLRLELAELFGASDKDVFFTSGATEALNIVLANTPRNSLVVSTMTRHNAVRRTVYAYGFKEVLLPPLDINNYKEQLGKSLQAGALLVLNACSNVNGHREPIKEICSYVKTKYPSVKIAVDAAQGAGHLPLSMQWGIDFLALTAHKGLYGPAGLGALIIETFLEIKPLIYGGTGAHSSALELSSASEGMFETGTKDGASLGAWLEGVKFVKETGIETLNAREIFLKDFFLKGIENWGWTAFKGEGALVSLLHPHFSSEELASILEEENIIIRGGMHCAPDMHKYLNSTGTARFSFGYFNTEDEIETVLSLLKSLR